MVQWKPLLPSTTTTSSLSFIYSQLICLLEREESIATYLNSFPLFDFQQMKETSVSTTTQQICTTKFK